MTGRSNQQVALIEAFEEAGVRGQIIGHGRALTYSYIKQRAAEPEIELRVGVFLMRVDEVLDDWPERGQRQRRWFDPADAAELIAEPKLARLIRHLPETARLDRAREGAVDLSLRPRKSASGYGNVLYPEASE